MNKIFVNVTNKCSKVIDLPIFVTVFVISTFIYKEEVFSRRNREEYWGTAMDEI